MFSVEPIRSGSGWLLGVEGEQDTAAEVVEGTVAEGDALNHLDGVVAALGETVGIRTVEGIENVGLPIAQHGEAGVELGNLSGEGKGAKDTETLLCRYGIPGRHELVELLLQQVGLTQITIKHKHTLHSRLAFLREPTHAAEQQLAALFEIASLLRQEPFLYALAYVLQRPCTVANDMEPVDHNCCIWEQGLGQRYVLLLHIRYEILHILSVRERG